MDTFRNTTSFVSNSDKGIANKAANHMTKNAAKGSQARHDSLGSTAKQAATIKDESVDLLIIGAGPAGLIAACWAAQYDMSTRIIDRKRGPTKTGHADGLQSRTLEILESFGIVDPILKQGVPDVDTCHWATKNSEGIIERQRSFDSEPGGASRFGQVLLSQGAIERVLNDYLIRKGVVVVEWNKEAVSLHVSAAPDENPLLSPITVGVKGAKKYEERIHARYLVACDGAHSWTGNQLNALTDIVSEDSTWGVLDIIPITDFPDIRRSCSINSQPHGSIMTVPRENRLVRFYIHLRDLEETAMQHPSCSPGAMVEMAKAIMKPYDLTYNHCDWWSIYPIGRRLARHYIPQERVFLAGDAAHTHSPKGGQGMNVSIQDTYNLMWKLAAVITNGANAMILATYDSERRPVAKTLMDLDSRLVQAYEMEEKDTSSGIYEIRGQYAGFIAGIDVTYSDSILVTGKETVDPNLARNIKLGARLPSFLVVFHCDGAPVQLAQRLVSDGAWRLLVFPGDLRQPETMHGLTRFTETFSNRSHLGHLQQIQSQWWRCPTIEFLLIQSCPRSAVNLLDLPELFHPYDDFMGWDYWRVFADDRDQAYTGYGIDKQGPGCLVLCRPDQHVAWVGGMEDVAGLDNYFSIFIGSSR